MAGLATLGGEGAASAQDWSTIVLPDQTPSRFDLWTGAYIGSKSWSAYSGVTLALFGPIDGDGWRLRAVGGYGAYEDERSGSVSFADILLGYQKQYDALTLKAFAGVTAADDLARIDGENAMSGPDCGFKGIFEGWLNMTERSWASLDLVWSSTHDGHQRLRVGFAVWPNLSLGLEAQATGRADSDGQRGGALVRYTWAGAEITASGGASLDSSLAMGAYGTVVVLARF
ncbi:MAG TPA: cellulose biosynthesis protein BcsS [Hyphomicrobiaceae bacterium]|nr:cellulose biosynthesis protein BcsS [Hyphomicrobiaceae bacterium]